MADEKTTESRTVEPIQVAVVGTGDGSKLPSGTEAVTQGAHDPNIIVNVVQPFVAIVVRFANLYGTVLIGLVTAGMTPVGGKLLYTSDFYHLVLTCGSLAFPAAALGLLKDLVTVFGKLEGKYPLITGSI